MTVTQTVLTDLLVPGVLDPEDFVIIGVNGVYLVGSHVGDENSLDSRVAQMQSKSDKLSAKIDHMVTPVLSSTTAGAGTTVSVQDRTLVCVPAAVSHVVAQPSERIDEEDLPRVVNRVACLVGVTRGARPASASQRQIEQQNKQMRRYTQRKRLRVGFAIVMVPLIAVTAKVLVSAPAPKPKAVIPVTTVAPAGVPEATESTTTIPVIGQNPVVAYAPSCPVAGEGWVIAAVWPGTIANLQTYEYSVQNIFNGEWTVIGRFAPGDQTGVALAKLPAGSTATTRVIPILIDGTRGAPIVAPAVVPSEAC